LKPLIGITCWYSADDDTGIHAKIGLPGQDWNLLSGDYVRAVERAGGIPLVIPILRSNKDIQLMIDRLDGLIVSGGNDVNPRLYGEEIDGKTGLLTPERDIMEIAALLYAIAQRDIPVLAICRGMQILNVAFGGTLVQDLQQEGWRDHALVSVPVGHHAHTVNIAAGSLLAQIVGDDPIEVNSYHHQAVRQVAADFGQSAVSADGVVEAIEMAGRHFVLGLQWHPEMLADDPVSLQLFQAFTDACRNL